MYGSLTEKELSEFLDEIENDDEDIKEAQEEANKKIALEEELSETPENAEIEEYYGDDAWRQIATNTTLLFGKEKKSRAIKSSIEANKQKLRNLKQDRIDIQRKAFSQEDINLSDPVGNENIKKLISLLVAEHTKMINKYESYINKRLAALLSPFIPHKLRACKTLYPNSIVLCPGFLYKASKEYGEGLTFWATPDIPYYFAQNTEQKILMQNKPEYLFSVDKAVVFYYEHLKKRTEKELKYASMTVQKGVYTYFDLLKLNPFWFDTLYNYLVNSKNK